jgi:phosphoglycerate-specific signal transduction histidine kinase
MTVFLWFKVGRALGGSILDVTNSNPLSRLVNSEFRTLQGLRNALKQEIDRNAIKAKTTSKVNWLQSVLTDEICAILQTEWFEERYI